MQKNAAVTHSMPVNAMGPAVGRERRACRASATRLRRPSTRPAVRLTQRLNPSQASTWTTTPTASSNRKLRHGTVIAPQNFWFTRLSTASSRAIQRPAPTPMPISAGPQWKNRTRRCGYSAHPAAAPMKRTSPA
jgi:hypothetical protein